MQHGALAHGVELLFDLLDVFDLEAGGIEQLIGRGGSQRIILAWRQQRAGRK